MLETNREYKIEYACCRQVSSRPEFRQRIVVIKAVRDLYLEPLTPQEFLRRPFIRRGRWLLKAKEQTGHWKQFYLESTKDHWRDCPLRLGWFEPDTNSKPVMRIENPFSNTNRDREILRKLLLKMPHENDGLVLRVFCDGLKIF